MTPTPAQCIQMLDESLASNVVLLDRCMPRERERVWGRINRLLDNRARQMRLRYSKKGRTQMKAEVKTLRMRTGNDGETRAEHSCGYRLKSAYATWQVDNLQPNTDYICAMIPVPKGFEAVSDRERDRSQNHAGARIFNLQESAWLQTGWTSMAMHGHDIYIRPKENSALTQAREEVAEARARLELAEALMREASA